MEIEIRLRPGARAPAWPQARMRSARPSSAARWRPGVIAWRMARNASPPGLPPTLAYLAPQAVGIDAECHDCHHKAVLGFELFLARYGDMPFPAFTRLLKCSACGSRKIDARPMWAKR